ncbi:uncharacterized protein LOC142632352 [Castanea sativa]|uniref:uncharacterized protein LOC142632352 n=1 Tax=Castanea sativa TaxID=21020 RepID=UPI003F64F06A
MSLDAANAVAAEEVTCEELERFLIGDDPERFFQVGVRLPHQEKMELVLFLKENVDVFVWDPYEAPGVDLNFIYYHLNVNPIVVPRRQPPRHSSKEHAEIVKEEVLRILGFGYKGLIAINVSRYTQCGGSRGGWCSVTTSGEDGIGYVLKENVDVFVWDPYEAPRVDLNFICHHLNVNPIIVLRRQPPRRSSKEHAEIVKEEVLRILGFGYEGLIAINVSRCTQCGGSRGGSGKFLGYMVTHKGIKVNSAPVRVINSLQPPQSPKEVRKLIGMTAALNRFISRSVDRPEVRYLPLEKAILAIVHATRKLPHYFQSHTIVVLTQLPLKLVLRSVHYSGRIAKWGTILGAFDIKYMPRTSVKGQVLTDLVAEFAEPSLEDSAKGLHMDEKSVGMISCKELPIWKVYVDGAANQRRSGVGLVLVSPEGLTFEKSLRLGFSATNNEAEYEALLVGMDMVQKMGGNQSKCSRILN